MAKEVISATVDTEIAEEVRKTADEEIRSFSQMVDLLLKEAIETRKQKKK